MLMNKPLWRILTPAEWDQVWHHVTTCDFPETAAVWCELGRDAGFGEARQVFVDPTDFLRLFRFEGVRRSRYGSAPISNSSGTTGQRCHNGALRTVVGAD
jgi:hypothetical protein